MIHLSVLQLEHTQSGYLAARDFIPPGRIELFLGLQDVLQRRNLLVERDVEIVVEVAGVAAHPRELPGVLLLERRDLLDRRTRDDDEGRVLVGEVTQVGKVSRHECAALTTLLSCRLEHEVVDDELGLRAKKVLERDRAICALEGVGLRHWDHGKGLPLRLDGIGGAGVLFLLV